jgi:Domain of unknown function (DUF4407)
MAMPKLYLIARLGGADGRMLADEELASRTGERTRFVAMGGVLLTTAGVATLSMFFALHHAVDLSVGWSICFALAWGVVIINIDRFLIITLTGNRGHPVRLTVTVLVRLVLAALISIVVATPLVLQIFHSDIWAELPVIQQQQSASFAKSQANDAQEGRLAKDDARLKAEQVVADGNGPSQVASDRAIVNRLASEELTVGGQVSAAYAKLECELNGLKGTNCPPHTSGEVGNGPFAHTDREAYENLEATYSGIEQQLATARANLKFATKAANQNQSDAQTQVSILTTDVNNLNATIAAAIANDTKRNGQDTGLLEQIRALFAAGASDPGLAWAHWIVTALFFVIEILPVTVKCLMLLGAETPYEKIVRERGDAAVHQAQVALAAEIGVAESQARSIRSIAELEARAKHDIRQVALESDLAIAQDRERARHGVEAEYTRRDRGTRIEADKRYASAARDHILAAIDDWALQIRDAIRQGTQRQAADDLVPYLTGQDAPGGNGRSAPGGNGQSAPGGNGQSAAGNNRPSGGGI